MQRSESKKIQNHLKATQSCQKSYADKRQRPLHFKASNYVYLKVSPIKGVHRFGVQGKLAPRYVGPFKIIACNWVVAYTLQLPPRMNVVFNVFHVSQLKKCLWAPTEAVDLKDIDLKSDLTYKEKPVRVLEESERVTQNKVVKFCKVAWNNHTEDKATWEQEDYLCTTYPAFYEKW
jgi:hypothetical protein